MALLSMMAVYISTINTVQKCNAMQRNPPTHFALAIAIARVFSAALARLALGSIVVGGTADPKCADAEPRV